jgi:hypothetical protein
MMEEVPYATSTIQSPKPIGIMLVSTVVDLNVEEQSSKT